MRAILIAFVLACSAGAAFADVAPDPGRPDFDDTPLPMPDEPEDWAACAALLAAISLMALRKRARAC